MRAPSIFLTGRDTAFDLCVVVGDFIPRPNGWTPAAETAEQLSSEEGEMSATLGERMAHPVSPTIVA